MTKFLAIDTATECGSVAVGEPGDTAAELVFAKRRHAAGLTPAVQEALRLAGIRYADLAGIIVADGPGSFTGLRIGFAAAKGILCQHNKLGLHTAPSLMAAAYGAHFSSDRPIAALYDALRGDVFGAVYQFRSSSVECLLPPTLGRIEALAEKCPDVPWMAVGDGAACCRNSVMAWTGQKTIYPPTQLPRASALLNLMTLEGATERVVDPASFDPDYGRLAEAQVRRMKKRRLESGKSDARHGE